MTISYKFLLHYFITQNSVVAIEKLETLIIVRQNN